jgi:hypothetical protein
MAPRRFFAPCYHPTPLTMKSPRGFLGAVGFLLALPLMLLWQALTGGGAQAVIHFALAAGAALMSVAVFDFVQVPRWIGWIGSVSIGALAGILFLQAISEVVNNESLTRVAYDVLGQRLEGRLTDVFFCFWCPALWLTESRGNRKWFGAIAVLAVAGLVAYEYFLAFRGTSLNQEAEVLKVLYFLPIVWLLLESSRARQARGHETK